MAETLDKRAVAALLKHQKHIAHEYISDAHSDLADVVADQATALKKLDDDYMNMTKAYSKCDFELKEAQERIAELEGQLPEGMEDCTIIFKECEVGHGRLTATNWVDSGCIMCRVQQAKQALSKE